MALALVLAACSSFQTPRDAPLQQGRATRLESRGRPIVVAVRATDGRPTFQYRQASLVQGRISAIRADTLIFSSLTRVDPVTEFDPLCRSTGAARVVLGGDWDGGVTVERFDGRRTIGGDLMGVAVGSIFLDGI